MSRSIINTATRGDAAKQGIATPWAFVRALEQRFGVAVDFDLAATPETSKAAPLPAGHANHFTAEINALKQDWSRIEVPRGRDMVRTRLRFLNPPFGHIKPWAHKLAECRWLTTWTIMLAPSSYDADWFQHLKRKVQIDAIPRIQFEGATQLYPKGLAVFIAGFGVCGEGDWDWRVSYAQWCRERGEVPEPAHAKGLKRFPQAAVLPDYSWTPSPFREVGT
jgi:hypothetical protein